MESFDSIPWNLMLKAVSKHTDLRWVNRPGIPGDSISWKRGWSHGQQAPVNEEVPG